MKGRRRAYRVLGEARRFRVGVGVEGALAAAIWHNRVTGQPITRSLIAYDH